MARHTELALTTSLGALILVVIGCSNSSTSSGALGIEECNGEFRYIDEEFLRRNHCFGTRLAPNNPLGYTVSRTPPDADVESIEELYTVCIGPGPPAFNIISRGRKIPRDKVVPKSYTPGNYVKTPNGDRIRCSSYSYDPPATASRWELDEARRRSGSPD